MPNTNGGTVVAEVPMAGLRRLLLVLEVFLVLSAFSGGLTLIASPGGELLGMPLSLLENTPFSSFLVPGIILTLVVGGSALVAGLALWRKAREAYLLCAASGLILVVWITTEVLMIQTFHWLHALYGGLGALLLALGLWGWRSGR